MDIKSLAEQYNDYIIDRRRYYHTCPELSGEEKNTRAHLKEDLEALGITDIHEMETCYGLTATIHGGKPGKTVALRADIDALPVKEETGLPFASQNDGVMHACGHDTHISMLLATAKVLCGMRDQLPGTVKLIFQPGEEKAPMGGARPMVEAGVMENPHVDAIMATHISPGGPKVGAVSMYNGIATTAFDLYNVKVTGQNAHGSQPQNGHDAILALAQFIVNAQQIVARRVNPLKTAIVSIGVIKGGEAVNIIPSTASLEMVCRTYGEETRKVIYDEVMRLARGTAELSACKFDVEHIEGYGSVVNDPKLLKIGAEAVAEALGPDYVDNLEEPLSFSEDFSYYGNATGTPSLFLLLNAGYLGDAPHSLHDARCTFQEEALECGVTAMVATALKILES